MVSTKNQLIKYKSSLNLPETSAEYEAKRIHFSLLKSAYKFDIISWRSMKTLAQDSQQTSVSKINVFQPARIITTAPPV